MPRCSVPDVSIIMPVRNSSSYLHEAVESVLQQTLDDFEFIIIDDGSTDGSVEMIRSFSDSRIVLMQNECHSGVAASLNRGLAVAKAPYIARMDADDVSMPHRLERQIAFLEANRQVGICGTWVRHFGNGRSYILTYPTGSDCVKAYLLLGNPLAHPSVCMRASVLVDHGLKYDESIGAAQDYEFWTRCSQVTGIDNIPEPLLRYRVHGGNVSKASQQASDEHATLAVAAQLRKLTQALTEEEIRFHRRVGHGAGMSTRDEVTRAEQWLKHLLHLNKEKSIWPQQGLAEAISFIWFRVCRNSIGLGFWTCMYYSKSELSSAYRPDLSASALFVLSVLKGWVSGRNPTGNLEIWSS